MACSCAESWLAIVQSCLGNQDLVPEQALYSSAPPGATILELVDGIPLESAFLVKPFLNWHKILSTGGAVLTALPYFRKMAEMANRAQSDSCIRNFKALPLGIFKYFV